MDAGCGFEGLFTRIPLASENLLTFSFTLTFPHFLWSIGIGHKKKLNPLQKVKILVFGHFGTKFATKKPDKIFSNFFVIDLLRYAEKYDLRMSSTLGCSLKQNKLQRFHIVFLLMC